MVDHMIPDDIITADTTGEYSIYTEYYKCEIMFHVSTLLPYQDNHKQQVKCVCMCWVCVMCSEWALY